MAGEELFVRGDVLERDDALAALELYDAINEQERIAVRQNRHDVGHGHGHLWSGRIWRSFGGLDGFSHEKSVSSFSFLEQVKSKTEVPPQRRKDTKENGFVAGSMWTLNYKGWRR